VSTDLNRAHACEQWPSALAVGQRALALVEPDGLQPADAVVPYSKVSFSEPAPRQIRQSRTDVTPDVDWPSADTTIQHEPGTDDARPTASSPACGAAKAQAMQDGAPNSAHSIALLPSRCLQDARTLLRNLIAPDNIASHNNNNQEDLP
jgi:hypothetical protein